MNMYVDEDNKTYWTIWYNHEQLGLIRYWKPWKKYVWEQDKDIIMSNGCLKQVLDFMEKIK